MSIIQRINEETKLGWTCPDCKTFYFCVSPMRFCPACRAEHDKLEQTYWDNKRSEFRSVSDDIVAKILEKGGTYGNPQ